MSNKGDILKPKSITSIKESLAKTSTEELDQFIQTYREDTRKGVIHLVNRAKNKQAYIDEVARVECMLQYERQLPLDYCIGGIDEAGRGPLAGPVVAAVVILNPKDPILYIDDSKKLTFQKKRCIIRRNHPAGNGVWNRRCIRRRY